MYALMDEKGYMRADGDDYSAVATVAQRIAEGEEDFDEAKIAPMNLVPDQYRGLERFEARKAVIADITAEGNAVMIADPKHKDEETEAPLIPYVENKKIMQPFGDRSGVVIEPMLTDQWFVDAETLAKPAIEAVREGRTKFVPENWDRTYYNWMENIEPWCISRQLWWGHRIPVWYGPNRWRLTDNGKEIFPSIFVASTEAEALEQAREHFREFYPEDFDLESHGFDVRVVDAPVADVQTGDGERYDPNPVSHGAG